MSKTLIAIDPGHTGGIAVFHGHKDVSVYDLEKDLKLMYMQLSKYTYTDPIVFVEDVGYHVRGNNAQASATFARHCGHIEMALTAHGYNWGKVKPIVWMKHALPAGRPRTYAKRKAWIRDKMQSRFPDLRVTLKNADALGLLLHLAKIQHIDI